MLIIYTINFITNFTILLNYELLILELATQGWWFYKKSHICIIVCRRFEPLFYRQPLLYGYPPPSLIHFIFFSNPWFWKSLHKHKLKKLIKLMWQSYFFIFRKLKNNATCLFYMQHFYKQHQAENWSKIVRISSIKRSQKKNERLNERATE